MHSGSEDYQQKFPLFLTPSLYLEGCLSFWTQVSENLAPRVLFLSHLIPGKWMKSQGTSQHKLLGSCSWEYRSHCKDSVKIGNAANPSNAKNHLTSHHLNRQKPKAFLTSKLILKRMSQHKKFLRGLPHLETKARQKSYDFKNVQATRKNKIMFWQVQRAASPISKLPLVCDTWETGILYEDAFPGIPLPALGTGTGSSGISSTDGPILHEICLTFL